MTGSPRSPLAALAVLAAAVGCGRGPTPGAAGPDAEPGPAADCGTLDYLRHVGPGPDQIWDSADDLIGGRGVYHLIDDDRWATRFDYGGPGPDQVWATDDDVITGLDRARYLEDRLVGVDGFTDPGPDAAWATGDDVQAGHHALRFEADRLTAEAFAVAPGPDATWATADDELDRVLAHRGDADGTRTTIVFTQPGGDGAWRTGDDLASGSLHWSFDDERRPTRIADRDDPGPDLAWGTDDDLIAAIVRYQCGEAWLDLTVFGGPGPDAAWDTDDDDVSRREIARGQADGSCQLDLCAPWVE